MVGATVLVAKLYHIGIDYKQQIGLLGLALETGFSSCAWTCLAQDEDLLMAPDDFSLRLIICSAFCEIVMQVI